MRPHAITAVALTAMMIGACSGSEPAAPALTTTETAAPVGNAGPAATPSNTPVTPPSPPPAAGRPGAQRPDGAAAPAASTPATSRNTPTPRPPAFREVRVPSGTSLPLELMTPLASDTAEVETPVTARLREPVLVDGEIALPAGAVFSGSVTIADDSGHVRGRSQLAFRFHEVNVRGTRHDVTTETVSFRGEASKGEDATKIGAGAGIGAAIGGLLGGGKGAAKGAVIGGAAGTGAVLATRGKEVRLAEGTNIASALAAPLTLRVPTR